MPTGEHKVDVLITFDFEEWEGRYSIYEADLYHKTQRVVNLLQELHVSATFFLDAHTTLLYPEAARLLADGGFELALHSDYHPGAVRDTGNRKRAQSVNIPDFRQDSETQISRIQHAISMIREVVPDFRPLGFRAPDLKWNRSLYTSLSKLNFLYDSSQKVYTFHPFQMNGIVVLPVNSGDYDSACYKMKPQYVLAVWKDRLSKACEAAARTGESCFVLLAHPSVSGKSKYIGLLKAILNHISWCSAQYLTCSELAINCKENIGSIQRENST
ncbi:polysaccharide deacetylase family protein [Candidatus Bathyarchaeota archaeon]|nr:polysaccharide deacetylase family protein [Candidatus Bathyarchaeota archaeon]